MSRETLIDAWRGTDAEIDEHLFWIKQHRETIRAGTERPDYIRHCRDRLAWRYDQYLDCLRRLSDFEEDMRDAGISFPPHRQEIAA